MRGERRLSKGSERLNMDIEQGSWICQVHAVLDKDEADDHDTSQLLIWKVPVRYRANAEHYEPVHWRFGLHNCPEILQTKGTEEFKIQVVKALQLTGQRWNQFCKEVVQEPKSYWEAMYGQSPHASSYTIEEIRCLLSLDALFLVVLLQIAGEGIKSWSPALQKVMNNPVLQVYLTTVELDYSLVENQIPMELLKRVVGILKSNGFVNLRPWEDEQWQGWNIGICVWWDIFDCPSIDAFKRDTLSAKRVEELLEHADSYQGLHILDSMYRILCGWKSLETPHMKDWEDVTSATYLEACGVKIKGKDFTCFEDISFENGCLSVPFLRVYDSTEKYLRNLVVHEMLTSPGHASTRESARCYTLFMDDLMKTSEDVNLLVKRGVLMVNVGSHDIVVAMWKRINYNLLEPRVSDKFFTMLRNLNDYTKLRRNKFRFEFQKQFCSRPWIVLSVLAVTFVTIATGIQTYVAVIGSNGMKPHFPPQH